MRALRVVCLFVLSLFVEGLPLAQSTEPGPAVKSAEDIQSIKRRAAEWLTTCMGDWDAQTHMSKSQWRTTCERVSREREQFLLNTPGAKSAGTRGIQ
jgi:hypothetical protein